MQMYSLPWAMRSHAHRLWPPEPQVTQWSYISFIGFQAKILKCNIPKSLCFIVLGESGDFEPGAWRWCQDVNMSIGIYCFWKLGHFQGMCSDSPLAWPCPLVPLKSSVSLSDLLLLSLWLIFSVLKQHLQLFLLFCLSRASNKHYWLSDQFWLVM